MISDAQSILRTLVYTYFTEEELQDLYRRFGLDPEEQASLWQILSTWRPLETYSTRELVFIAEKWVADTPNLSAVSRALTALTTELAERSAWARRTPE